MSALRNLPQVLIDERGMPGLGVSIKRRDQKKSGLVTCSVGEWLDRPEHQSGGWLIDGGWGGPPGPIYVHWDQQSGAWVNWGFCGHIRYDNRHTDSRP